MAIATSDNSAYRRRRRTNAVMMSVSTLALLFGLFWLLWILGVLLYEGGTALRPTILYQMTPPPGSDGGLANAIMGSILMAGAAVIALRIGNTRQAAPLVMVSTGSAPGPGGRAPSDSTPQDLYPDK